MNPLPLLLAMLSSPKEAEAQYEKHRQSQAASHQLDVLDLFEQSSWLAEVYSLYGEPPVEDVFFIPKLLHLWLSRVDPIDAVLYLRGAIDFRFDDETGGLRRVIIL